MPTEWPPAQYASAATPSPFPMQANVTETPGQDAANATRRIFEMNGRANEQRVLASRGRLSELLALTEELSATQEISRDYLRSVAPRLDQPTWSDIVQERHNAGVCGYPGCVKRPSRDYQASQRRPMDRDPYCSSVCMRRSEHYATACIGTGAPYLLEDVTDPPAPIIIPPPPLPSVNGVQTLLSELHIHERSPAHDLVLPPSSDQPPLEATLDSSKVAPIAAVAGMTRALDQMDLDDGASEADSEVYEEEDLDLRAMVREGMAIRDALRASGEDL